MTLDDKPVEEGAITFIPDGGNQGPSTGAGIVQGDYKVQHGVVLGKNRVEIIATARTGKKVPAPGRPGVFDDERISIIPEKYNRKTELTVDVQPGANKFDFHLTTK